MSCESFKEQPSLDSEFDLLPLAKKPRKRISVFYESVHSFPSNSTVVPIPQQCEEDTQEISNMIPTDYGQSNFSIPDHKEENYDCCDELIAVADEFMPAIESIPATVGKVVPCRALKSLKHKEIVMKMRLLRHSSVVKAIQAAEKIMLSPDKGWPLDLKIAALQSLVPSTIEGVKILEYCLKQCDKPECENPIILKCRLHCKLMWAHSCCSKEECEKHTIAALSVSEQVGQDIGPLVTEEYYAQLKQRKMNLPITENSEDQHLVREIEKHYLKILKSDVPSWMEFFKVTAMRHLALLKMTEAVSYHKVQLHLKATACFETGSYLIKRLEEMEELTELDNGYIECIKSLQYHIQGDQSMARQFQHQCIDRLNQCGRHVSFVTKLFDHCTSMN